MKLKTLLVKSALLFGLSNCATAQSQQVARSESNSPDPQQVALLEAAQNMQAMYGTEQAPEGAKMFMAIASGSKMGPGEGWFGPAHSKYTFEWLAKSEISNSDGIARGTFSNSSEIFDVLDRNRDGLIQPFDLDWKESNPYVELSYTLNRVFRRLDVTGSGVLTREDWIKFYDEATKGTNSLTAEQFSGTLLAGFGGGFNSGDGPSTETLLKGLFSGEIGSMYEGPNVGDNAPLFELRKAQGDGTIRLKSLLEDKPVVLVFGNFTCGPFRAYYPAVDRLFEKYQDRAHFVMVYVREAHPDDGWKMQSNARAGVAVQQPTSFEERAKVAGQFCQRLNPRMPVVVDEVTDPMGHAYSGMPARLYVVAPDGKVVFKSGRGPFGFKPPELEQALVMSILEQESEKKKKQADQSAEVSTFPSDQDAWKLLPTPVVGGDLPLPNWAKLMSLQLPRTTAALLQLDFAHRTKSPLDPKLRAKMRYVISQVNHCQYSQRTAALDLINAGSSQEDLNKILEGETAWDPVDRDALKFAQLLSSDAAHIEDALFQKLVNKFGESKVAAMVLLGAYGNFQDRLLLGLGVQPEADLALPPLAIEFDASVFQTQPIFPSSQPAHPLIEGGKDLIQDDADWDSIAFDELQSRLKQQRSRKQRLPTPAWDAVAAKLPQSFSARPTRIVWNLVCSGYAPELAVPWSVATRTMWAEAPQDRVFEECLFWVQTRAVQCNYCMGHCEMLLEVAGLSSHDISDRLKALASNNWGSFNDKEQRTFAYARKLTLVPWELTAQDYQQLEQDLGKKEAMAIFFWLCRGLYMTRVSDGFQLRLESDNVFADYAPSKPNK